MSMLKTINDEVKQKRFKVITLKIPTTILHVLQVRSKENYRSVEDEIMHHMTLSNRNYVNKRGFRNFHDFLTSTDVLCQREVLL